MPRYRYNLSETELEDKILYTMDIYIILFFSYGLFLCTQFLLILLFSTWKYQKWDKQE